jgi:ribonucleoside-diphosphate reductase alpha chain
MNRSKVPVGAPHVARRPSAFIDPVAVEAWDEWFRWRENGELRDVTIEDTWSRVANALAAGEPPEERRAWAQRFGDALASWRLLPDERLMMSAATPSGGRATLNVAAFIRAPFTAKATFDRAGFEDTAALAVRAVDNTCTRDRARIGIIGLGDALALLGLRYASDAGRAFASEVMRTLAHSCLRASARLAAERGGALPDPRFVVDPQPRLAKFANRVSDALDPCDGAGYAASLKRRIVGAHASLECCVANSADRAAMRAACAPYVDL